MSLYGAMAENTRRNERIERGSATFTGSTVITVAGPMRQVTYADATQVIATAPGVGPSTITVGNIGSGGGNAANQFTIFAWQPTSNSNPTLVAATTPCTVNWTALGNLSGGAGF